MGQEGALGGGAVLGATVRGGGAGVRQAAVLLVRGGGALVPLAQLIGHGGAPRALVVGALAAQRWSPQDLRARWRQAAGVALLTGPPALPEQAARGVGIGGLELCLDAVVALLVALQAAHNHGRGAPLNVQRVLLDAVLRAGLALTVQVDSRWVPAAAPPRGQVGHAARVRCAQRACRPLSLPLPGTRLGGRVLRQGGVVGIHLRWVVVLGAGVAGAG